MRSDDYQFGPFRIDAVKRVLFRDGQPVPLTSKSLDTLLMLVEHRGRVVAKDDLMKALWPDTVVEENNLTQQISTLRKALGEKVNEHRYVVTVPGRGYSFVAHVSLGGDTNEPARSVRRPDLSAFAPSEFLELRRDKPSRDGNPWTTRVLLTASLAVAGLSLFAYGLSLRRAPLVAVTVSVNGNDRKDVKKRATENPAAYQEYLEGRHFWNRRDTEGLTKSVEHFQRAIDLDANYAQAYAGLADAYTLLVSYRVDAIPAAEAARRARDAASRALALDESLAEAHASLAMITSSYDRDQPGAELEFKRAIELDPGYATAHHWYSEYLTLNDREDEAVQEIRRAYAIDPLSAVISTTLAEHLYFARHYDEAIAQARKTLDISPGFGPGHFILGLALEQKGLFDQAIAELQKAKATAALDRAAGASLAHSYALAGRRLDARKVLDELLSAQSAGPYEIAVVYQGLGEREQVFDWLEKIERKEGELHRLLRFDPRLDSLRTEPRFQNLLRPVHL